MKAAITTLFFIFCTFQRLECDILYEERHIDVGPAKIFCRVMGQVTGQGSPVLVIHGGPGLCHDYLLPAMAELASNQKVIFYDQRGGGNSGGTIDPATITIDNFVEDIEAIRKAFGIGKISLLGHSWGGHLAMKYATRHPESVDKLILVSSAPANSEDFLLFMQEWTRRVGPYMKEIHLIEETNSYKRGDSETVAQTLKLTFRTYCFRPDDVEKLNLKFSPLANVNGLTSYKILSQNYLSKQFDLTADLKSLTCKTLILHGDVDPIPMLAARHIQESIRGSKLVVLNQCGHFPYVEKPEQFFFLVNEFLK
jgi:proline iminopeptidase